MTLTPQLTIQSNLNFYLEIIFRMVLIPAILLFLANRYLLNRGVDQARLPDPKRRDDHL